MSRSSAARLSAERRRCPKCNRKSALTYYTHFDQVIASCIYNACDYESVTDLNRSP